CALPIYLARDLSSAAQRGHELHDDRACRVVRSTERQDDDAVAAARHDDEVNGHFELTEAVHQPLRLPAEGFRLAAGVDDEKRRRLGGEERHRRRELLPVRLAASRKTLAVVIDLRAEVPCLL